MFIKTGNDMRKLGMKMFIAEIKLMRLKRRIGKPYDKSINRLLLAAELIRSNNHNDNY